MLCNIVCKKSKKVVAQARPQNNLWCLDFKVRNQPKTLETTSKPTKIDSKKIANSAISVLITYSALAWRQHG